MTKRMTDADLAAIRQRCEAATPGPWGLDKDILAMLAEIDALREDAQHYAATCEIAAKRLRERDNEIERLRKENQELVVECRDLGRVIDELRAEVAKHAN